MKRISKFFSDNPRYRRYKKPLEAAEVCDTARQVSEDEYSIISFNKGLLTISCSSSAEASNLQSESQEIIKKINQKIGEEKVKRVRFKI